jgi:hypothetical protein
MKKYCYVLLLSLVSIVCNAQEDSIPKKKFILASVSYEMGPMLDRYEAVDLDMMYDLTSNPSDIERDLLGHDPLFDTNVEGSRLGASISLIPLSKKDNDYSTLGEIRLGLFYMVRGTHLSYSLTNASGAYKAVGYSTRFKELSLQGAYVWKYTPKFAERFTLHAGIGFGFGSTVVDRTSVAEIISSGQPAEVPNSIFNEYEGNTSLFIRGYAPIGIDFAISERFDLGIQSYFGVVSQQVIGGENYFIPISGSVGVRLSYFF